MDNPSCLNGLNLVPLPDQSADLPEQTGTARATNDAATRLPYVLCQLDEVRRLNKRLELEDLERVGRNQALEAHNQALEARNQALEARIGCRRYRLIDRMHRLTGRVPLLHRVGRFVLVKGWAVAKRLRSWCAFRARPRGDGVR